MRNRASVVANVARCAYRLAPYPCMRIDATRLFGTESVFDNRCRFSATSNKTSINLPCMRRVKRLSGKDSIKNQIVRCRVCDPRTRQECLYRYIDGSRRCECGAVTSSSSLNTQLTCRGGARAACDGRRYEYF
ncbi:hypothetical protein EVAR_89934_1 [Eumeta japonica]|uniref:Uncharacterized protein n=1 Tax=Eumeta variegata TaxID=151549 RepID=A0A4C1XRM3_EUMVA|nr:hypothetical protein EVAR_89934_1 [Eumeta japonica]